MSQPTRSMSCCEKLREWIQVNCRCFLRHVFCCVCIMSRCPTDVIPPDTSTHSTARGTQTLPRPEGITEDESADDEKSETDTKTGESDHVEPD